MALSARVEPSTHLVKAAWPSAKEKFAPRCQSPGMFSQTLIGPCPGEPSGVKPKCPSSMENSASSTNTKACDGLGVVICKVFFVHMITGQTVMRSPDIFAAHV